MTSSPHPSSFRDPKGFLFQRQGQLYRQINASYQNTYDLLMSSGLYDQLTEQELLISYVESQEPGFAPAEAYKVIKPKTIPFVSYPHEWTFSQLKQAALLTLEIQEKSLEYGMSLKDASAYNVQFIGHKPIFIDTLSFEKYPEDRPWTAYRQFCQHFLAPLALMSYTDVRLNQLFRVYMDGLPLDLAGTLLPFRSKLKPSLYMHLHLHARSQRYFEDKDTKMKNAKVSLFQLKAILSSLGGLIKNLKYKNRSTEWANYYAETNYSDDAFNHKKDVVKNYMNKIDHAGVVWDFGANTGVFSRIAKERADTVVAFDYDFNAVEQNYVQASANRENNILPLCLDLTNPSGAFGWGHQERLSLADRSPADVIIALALIHHLVISNNIPFSMVARYFSCLSPYLIIEYIPKEDSQVQKLLRVREDVFTDYTATHFEQAFQQYYQIVDSTDLKDSGRKMYLMRRTAH